MNITREQIEQAEKRLRGSKTATLASVSLILGVPYGALQRALKQTFGKEGYAELMGRPARPSKPADTPADDPPNKQADDQPTEGTRFQTTAPTQRVRSWLSAAKRFISETKTLTGLVAESKLSDNERRVVESGLENVRASAMQLEGLALFEVDIEG